VWWPLLGGRMDGSEVATARRQHGVLLSAQTAVAEPASSSAHCWCLQVHNLTSISLLEGPAYYVTVVAYNGAGPPLSTNTSSILVYVDTSGPQPAAVYNT
jgi:hypothetical protein